MVSAYFVLRADIARRHLAPSPGAEAEILIAIPCLAGIVGAKLYHDLQSPDEFFAHPLQELFSAYGFAWFGGLLVGFAAFVLVARYRKISLLAVLDAGSPAAALGYGVGRIGCLLSGDGDYGTPTSLPWGMSFPNGLVPTSDRVHPTPIYELLAACAIAWLLWRIGALQIGNESFPQAKNRKQGVKLKDQANPASRVPQGAVFAAYLVLTGFERFLIEFIRINPRTFLGMSNAQAASLLSIIAGGLLWSQLRRASA